MLLKPEKIIAKNTLPDVVFAIFILKKHKSLTICGEFEINFKNYAYLRFCRLEAPAKNRGIAMRSRRRKSLYSFCGKAWKLEAYGE